MLITRKKKDLYKQELRTTFVSVPKEVPKFSFTTYLVVSFSFKTDCLHKRNNLFHSNDSINLLASFPIKSHSVRGKPLVLSSIETFGGGKHFFPSPLKRDEENDTMDISWGGEGSLKQPVSKPNQSVSPLLKELII